MTAPHYADDHVTLWHDDALRALRADELGYDFDLGYGTTRAFPDASIDAVVTDPPYGLGFMGHKWDTYANETGRRPGTKASFDHVGGNHNPTDAADAARTRRVESARFGQWCEPWARECLRVLKPGGYLLAFGGSRTWHRLAAAVEDAGFEVRDSIAWMYGCHDDRTEVLTARGWINGLDLTERDEVAQWHTDGTITLVRPTARQRYPFDGRLVRFRNADVDQLVTPNHRVYLQVPERTQVDGKGTAQWSDWRVEQAAEVSRRQRMRLPAAGIHSGPGVGGTDYAALLGLVWAGGGLDPAGTGVRVYQSPTNALLADEIATLLDRLGAHKRYDDDRTWNGRPSTATSWYVSGDLARRVRDDLPGRSPTWHLLWRMTADEKRAMWDAAMKGDGPKGARMFRQKIRADLEWAQALLAAIGCRGKIAADPRGVLHWTDHPTVELQAQHLADVGEDYTGEVWCVTVPSGAFIVRRNSLVSVSGNSGFPKSLDVSKAIDKAARGVPQGGADPTSPNDGRYRTTTTEGKRWDGDSGRGYAAGGSGFLVAGTANGSDTEPAASGDAAIAPEAKAWQGWGTALKPGFEPVVVARKPLEGTVARNVLTYGTGALNIDACRIPATDGQLAQKYASVQKACSRSNTVYGADTRGRTGAAPHAGGRWPTNVVLSHSPLIDPGTGEVIGDACANGCAPGCAVAELDAQSGPSRSRRGKPRSARHGQGWGMTATGQEYTDAGGASRFFPVFRFEAKAPTAERPRTAEVTTRADSCPVCDAAKAEGLNPRTAFTEPTYERHVELHHPMVTRPGVAHPTVKPLDLIRWMVRLVCPPGGVVLDPFAGSGTTAEACLIEGLRCVTIEREAEYLDLIRVRLERVPLTLDLGDVA